MEQKKNPEKDLERSRSPLLALGMVVSLAIAITAFEWRTIQEPIVDLGVIDDQFQDNEIIPQTIQPPPEPPKPKVVLTKVVETKEEVEPPEDLIILEPEEFDPGEILIPYEPEEEPVEEVLSFVEEMPSPEGGMQAFYSFLSKKMKYPKQARRMGMEGKVFVQFVVNEEGKMTDLEVVRGIGVGCDEEALRVMKLAPDWNPGKQRGRPVKVRMVVPIYFHLKN
ncbi:MAG: energy transducer TonB [Cytophagales bacterium]|nr:energy transducer TonB [Cytophagales bacterium]